MFDISDHLRFPYQVTLKINGTIDPFCGGSLISERFVLTAAHCLVDRRNPANIVVVLGEHDTSHSCDKEVTKMKTQNLLFEVQKKDFVNQSKYWCSVNYFQKEVGVSAIIIHQNFKKHRNSTLENDLALVKLSENVTISASISPICLPDKLTSNLKLLGMLLHKY